MSPPTLQDSSSKPLPGPHVAQDDPPTTQTQAKDSNPSPQPPPTHPDGQSDRTHVLGTLARTKGFHPLPATTRDEVRSPIGTWKATSEHLLHRPWEHDPKPPPVIPRRPPQSAVAFWARTSYWPDSANRTPLPVEPCAISALAAATPCIRGRNCPSGPARRRGLHFHATVTGSKEWLLFKALGQNLEGRFGYSLVRQPPTHFDVIWNMATNRPILAPLDPFWDWDSSINWHILLPNIAYPLRRCGICKEL